MSEFYFQTVQLEIEIIFSTYSLKFNSYQKYLETNPVGKLLFQRFMHWSDYNTLQHVNLTEKLCAQLVILDSLYQTELQNIFCSNLLMQNATNDSVVAEVIDENAGFVYLIIAINKTYMNYNSFCQNATFSIFKFEFTELWNICPSATSYIKNLQMGNSLMVKQLQELNICCNYYQQQINRLENSIKTKENQLGSVVKIAQKNKNNFVKKIQNLKNTTPKNEPPSIDCLLCCNNPRNIVFLPCGHIVACKNCTTDCLNIDLAKIINQRRNPKDCPVCKQSIKEAREIFI